MVVLVGCAVPAYPTRTVRGCAEEEGSSCRGWPCVLPAEPTGQHALEGYYFG